MAKISRTVKVYTYTFGKYDIASGMVIEVEHYKYLHRMNRKELSDISKATGKMLLHDTVVTKEYSMTVTQFVQACEMVHEMEDGGDNSQEVIFYPDAANTESDEMEDNNQ